MTMAAKHLHKLASFRPERWQNVHGKGSQMTQQVDAELQNREDLPKAVSKWRGVPSPLAGEAARFAMNKRR